MSKYITIDGRSYYSPCSECKDGYCSSCVIHKYQEDLISERDKRTSAEWCIERELEPRIKAEKRAYDFWVSEDVGVRECEGFCDTLDDLVDMVQDNEVYFEWDAKDGDLYEKVLYLINEHIREKNNDTRRN